MRVLRAVAAKLNVLNAGRAVHQRYQGMILADSTNAAADVLLAQWNTIPDRPEAAVYYHKKKSNPLTLSKFTKHRTIVVLIVVHMLKEGFNHPPVSVIGITRNIGSPLFFTQFIGRAFRIIRKADGTPDATANREAFIYAGAEHKQQKNWNTFWDERLIDSDPKPANILKKVKPAAASPDADRPDTDSDV